MQQLSKFINTTARLVTIFALVGLVLLTISQIFSVNADTEVKKAFTDPEAFLILQFKDNIKSKQIISELPKSEHYGIIYNTSLITINNTLLPITQDGQFIYSNLEKPLKTEIETFVNTAEFAKNKGIKNLKTFNNKSLDTTAASSLFSVLSKFSVKDLKSKSTNDYYKSTNAQIMILIGSQKELGSIKARFSNEKKNNLNTKYLIQSAYFTKKDLAAKQQEFKKEVEKLKKQGVNVEKAVNQVTKKVITQLLGSKNPVSNIADLSKETITKIDKILKIDIFRK